MKTNMLIRARQHFNCADAKTNRHNQRQWVRSIRFLGDKWLLAAPIVKRSAV
jgi:hypothetical protein